MGAARSLALWADGSPDLCTLAAGFAFGMVNARRSCRRQQTHRIQTDFVVLHLNGINLHAPDREVVAMLEGLAGNTVPEAECARWLRAY